MFFALPVFFLKEDDSYFFDENYRTRQEQIKALNDKFDEHKENILQNLAASKRFCLPIRPATDKPFICSWFAANGLTCDKNVFVERECGYECCCWTVSLQKKKSLWSRLFGK